MTRRARIICILCLASGFALGWFTRDIPQPESMPADDRPLSASFDDRVSVTMAAMKEAEDELPPADRARFKLWKKPLEALAAHSTAKQLQAEAEAIEKGVALEDGKKGFVILGSVIAGAVIALVKLIVKLWLLKIVTAYIWAHIWWVLGICGGFWFVVWLIAKTTAWRTAWAVVAKAKVAK